MKIVKFIIPFIIAIVILIILINNIDINNLKSALENSNFLLIFISSLLLLILVPVITAFRWRQVLKILNCNISFIQSLQLYLASLPFAKISPANAGDFVRSYYLNHKISASKNSGGIILERMMDIAVLSILAIISGLITEINIAIYIGILVLLFIILFFIFGQKINIKNSSKWHNILNNIFYIFKIIIKKPIILLNIVLYTFLLWSVIIIYIKYIFLSLGFDISIITISALQPIVIFFGLLPITISGIGTRESAMLFLYAGLAPSSSILAVGLTYSFFGSIVLPILGLPFMYKVLNKKSLNKRTL